jgi:hypothetical protein
LIGGKLYELRVQFGRTIGSFQAIKHRAPTCYWKWNWPSPPPTMQRKPPQLTTRVARWRVWKTGIGMYLHIAVECVQIGGISLLGQRHTSVV